MLYFEDFMEAIESLPSDLKDNLTAMRQLDLQAQNTMEPLDYLTEQFFLKCKQGQLTGAARDQEYQRLCGEFDKALACSKEKKDIAHHISHTYDKCMRKLDTELSKFKLELEADNAGIAEMIEQNVLESESSQNPSLQSKRARMRMANSRIRRDGLGKARNKQGGSIDPASGGALGESGADTLMTSAMASSGSAAMLAGFVPDSPSSVYGTGSVGTPGGTGTPVSAYRRKWPQPGEPSRKRQKLTTLMSDEADILGEDSGSVAGGIFDPVSAVPGIDPPGGAAVWVGGEEDTTRYCLCGDVSHGEMVACDNDDCPFEWFHYGCVGLSVAPKGKWYCPKCKETIRKRGRR